MNEDTLTAMFDDLAARGPWTGADSTASVPLPDGRTMWLFSDTMLGTVRPDHSRDPATPMVRNSMVIQDGETLTPVVGGTPESPDAIIRTTGPGFCWIGAGVADSRGVHMLANVYRQTRAGQFGFELAGTVCASVDPDAGATASVRPLWLGRHVAWGSAIVSHGPYGYIFGSEFHDGRRYAHVVRTRGAIGDPGWRFWTGKTWSANPQRSARILEGVGTAFGVQRVGRSWILVTVDCREPFTGDVLAYPAPTPAGPFGEPVHLLTAPEFDELGRIVYDARVHPHLADPGRMLISYNVHSTDPRVLFSDARVYRPRFASVPIPA